MKKGVKARSSKNKKSVKSKSSKKIKKNDKSAFIFLVLFVLIFIIFSFISFINLFYHKENLKEQDVGDLYSIFFKPNIDEVLNLITAGDECSIDSDCNDYNSCTQDFCLDTGYGYGSEKVCLNNMITSCNNGDGCCASGCIHSTDSDCSTSICLINSDCSDNNLCNGIESCNNGTCHIGISLGCNDGNSCTTDSCNPLTGCSNIIISSCINSDLCCSSGCTSINDNDCLGCNNNSECSSLDDSCNYWICSSNVCLKQQKENGTICDDSNSCTISDSCNSGICTGNFDNQIHGCSSTGGENGNNGGNGGGSGGGTGAGSGGASGAGGIFISQSQSSGGCNSPLINFVCDGWVCGQKKDVCGYTRFCGGCKSGEECLSGKCLIINRSLCKAKSCSDILLKDMCKTGKTEIKIDDGCNNSLICNCPERALKTYIYYWILIIFLLILLFIVLYYIYKNTKNKIKEIKREKTDEVKNKSDSNNKPQNN